MMKAARTTARHAPGNRHAHALANANTQARLSLSTHTHSTCVYTRYAFHPSSNSPQSQVKKATLTPRMRVRMPPSFAKSPNE